MSCVHGTERIKKPRFDLSKPQSYVVVDRYYTADENMNI